MTDSRRPFVEGEYYTTRSEKQQFLRGIFDRTAPYYRGIARWGWFGSGAAYRKWALRRAGVEPHMRVIDVASGTGQVGRALMEIVRSPDQIVCVEPSSGMIAESRKVLPVLHHQSTAEKLPVGDAEFDFLTMGFALRHVDDLVETFTEFARVLKPGAKLLIMDVTMPDSALGRVLFRAYFKHILPGLCLTFTCNRDTWRLMRYYWDTMEQMTPREEVARYLQEAGLTAVGHKVYLGCFSEYTATKP